MQHHPITTLALILVAILSTAPAEAQRKGQNVSVQYGTVIQKEQVDLNSGAVPRGAVVGGALGLASAKEKQRKRLAMPDWSRRRRAIASSSQGSTNGMLYTIDLGSNGMAQVVTDQQIVRGDCVAWRRPVKPPMFGVFPQHTVNPVTLRPSLRWQKMTQRTRTSATRPSNWW